MKISLRIILLVGMLLVYPLCLYAQTNGGMPGEFSAPWEMDSLKSYPQGQSVGLVLSGGGAKGIAHIGVIKALEENDIPIDYVAGTSMGAIIGGLYAAGYTPDEMLALINSPGFADWSTGTIDPNLTYYFIQKPKTPAFANVNVNTQRSDSADRAASLMPQSLISPLPMNFAFMDLFAGYTAQCNGNFDDLFVPFRCVTSDVEAKRKIVCRSGHLSDAIRASMTFPPVFEPIKIDGVYVYDGGIYDNFPVDVMREDFAPDFILGIDVHAEESGPQSNSIINQLENMIIQNQSYEIPQEEGMRIHVDVGQFSLLDFGKANEICAIGYKTALEKMDSLCERVTARIPQETREVRRQVFKSKTPYVRFDSVHVSGGTPKQNAYIANLFKSAKTDTFGIQHARLAYYSALSPGRLRNLFPQADYNASTGMFTLDMQADVKSNLSLGAGGYLSSSVNSMIFVSAEYSAMSFRSAEVKGMAWIGQNYMAGQLNGRLYLATSLPSAFELEGVYSRKKYFESDKLFYQDNSPAFITHYEGFGRLSYAWAVTRSGKASVGVGGGQVRDNFYSSEGGDFSSSGKERTVYNLAQAIGRLEFNTLDNQQFPSSGYNVKVSVMELYGKHHFRQSLTDGTNISRDNSKTHWFQAEVNGGVYLPVHRNFSFGVTWDALVSTRRLTDSYYASIVNAPGFAPTPAIDGVFNKRLHANSFAAVGVLPIWRPFSRAQVRLSANIFMPAQRIELGDDGKAHYGGWFRNPEFVGELDLVYNLPFASVCGYVNYLSYPAHNWNVGLSFGLYFHALEFLR